MYGLLVGLTLFMGAVRAVAFYVAVFGALCHAACWWPPALFTLTPFSLIQGQGICHNATVATFLPATTPSRLLPLRFPLCRCGCTVCWLA